jgi:pyruvate/2-oxoglutarate dehydrogenase complex dihydrolipoamide dehydrogenase (E3) component
VNLSTPVDASIVAESNPDEVVIATGSTPRSDGFQLLTPAVPIPGFDGPHVHTSWALFGVGRAPAALDGPALIYDDTGSFEAISAADVLLRAGAKVTLVSRFDGIGSALPYPPVTVGAARERLYAGDFDFIGGHYIRGITEDAVELGVQYTTRTRSVEASLVVLVGFNEPNRDLAQELNAESVTHHLIGDVRGRNSLMSAIHAGASLGRTI